MVRVPQGAYEEPIELLIADLTRSRRHRTRSPNGSIEEVEFYYFDTIVGMAGDSTGLGDFPMEFLQSHSGLPVGNESLVKFTLQFKHEIYTKWEAAISRDEVDTIRFSYPADHPLSAMFEEQAQAFIIPTSRTHATTSRTRRP